MRTFFVIKIFFYDLRIMFFSMRVIDKKNCVKSNYCKTHINIKKIAKKIANLQKKLHSFSLFEVLCSWVKFRHLKSEFCRDIRKNQRFCTVDFLNNRSTDIAKFLFL